MQVWYHELYELRNLFESVKGQFPDVDKEVEQLFRTNDANVIMLYSRRCLEVIIKDLCESELHRPRKTEPLKGIIDKLNKEEKVPSHIITSMDHLNSLSNYGTHPKDFDPEQVKQVLSNLAITLRWYKKYKDTRTGWKLKRVEVSENKQSEITVNTRYNSFPRINRQMGGFPKSILSGIRKYFFTILIIASLIALLLNWKGLTDFIGIGNSKREESKLHVEYALTCFKKGDYEGAKAELKLALTSDPKYSYAWSSLAAVNVKQGNLDQAILETIEAIKFDPENHEAAFNIAFALEDKQDHTQAIEWYLKAIKINPSFVPAYSALGNLYNKLNQPVDAILVLNQARGKNSGSEYKYLIYKNLGNAFRLQNQEDSAIKYLELSRNIEPRVAETNLYLAKVYETTGQITKSIDLWQKYIELETDTIKIIEAKKHLKEITIKHLKEIIK